jgi:methylmalonyl-CoA mutase N-terminal domain/subunit
MTLPDPSTTPAAKPKREKPPLREVTLESGIPVQPVYGPSQLDAAGFTYDKDLGDPGQFPFTRGIHPMMYRERAWTMRQYSGFGTPEATNARWKVLIANGQNALNVAFDLPSQMGLDSDDPQSKGEVGRVGMAVDSIHDFRTAFDGIPLEKISSSLTINAPASVMIAMYLVTAQEQGVPLTEVRGTAQNDILKEYVGRGMWVFPVEKSIKLIADTIEYCANHAPKYNPVSVCGYHIRESGANPVQEMAYGFAIALAYADQAIARGLSVDDFAGRLSFNFNIYGNIWEQVAKFRGGRKTWASLIQERYAPKDPKSMHMRMIAGGGGSGLTWEQPENNIMRGAYYALISALGGAQTMALCSYDEAYTIPSEKAALLSLRTMQILADEMGLTDTVDPIAGSYYVESLTLEFEKRIREEMERVDKEWGGIVESIRSGKLQRAVTAQAVKMERDIQEGRFTKIGVNKHRMEEADAETLADVDLEPYDQAAADAKAESVRALRANRNKQKWEASMNGLADAIGAGDKVNVMPAISEAVRSEATVGEIMGAMLSKWGRFKEPPL